MELKKKRIGPWFPRKEFVSRFGKLYRIIDNERFQDGMINMSAWYYKCDDGVVRVLVIPKGGFPDTTGLWDFHGVDQTN